MTEVVEDLARALVRKASLSGQVQKVSLFPRGWTNKNWLIELTSGDRCVLRQYQWPHESPDLKRVEKEIYLHGLLAQAGVPVAHVLANYPDDDSPALLMEYLPGELLGEVTPRLSEDERDDAWRTCGQALRLAHGIKFGADVHGVIIGNQVEPAVPDTWGHWRMHNLLHHAKALRDIHGLPIPVDELKDLIEGALPLLNDFHPCLLHNDAHVWNVLVGETDDGWRCTGLLDWEYAWVGDPTWDLARADMWRIQDIGPTPDAFWVGYGHRPVEPHFTFHQMSLNFWQANDQLSAPSSAASASHTKALDYVSDFKTHLLKFRRILEA